MGDSSFFKGIWRFNAIVIAIAGLLSIFCLVFAGYNISKEIFGHRQIEDVVNITDSSDVDEKWSLGHLRMLEGTDCAIIPLESDQSYAQSYYSKSSNSYRNYLFFDIKTNEQNWLFTQNKWLIAQTEYLYDKEYGEKDRRVLALLYQIVKSDTNLDNRLTTQDNITVALGSITGKKYNEILSSIDRFIGHSVIGNEEVLIIYQKKNIGYVARISLITFDLLDDRELEKIKSNS